MGKSNTGEKSCVYCGGKNKKLSLSCRRCRKPFPVYQALVAGVIVAGALSLLVTLLLLDY